MRRLAIALLRFSRSQQLRTTESLASHRKAAGADLRRRLRRRPAAGRRSRSIVGGATLDIWWAQAIALTGDGPGWSSVESGTLVGAMRVSGTFKEIRGKVVEPGVYTLRYGQQPQNGDHLGISTFREFLRDQPGRASTPIRRCLASTASSRCRSR